MPGLIIKDILIQKKTICLCVACIVLVPMFARTNTPLQGVFWLLAIAWYSLSIGAFFQDDKSKSETVINSLPLSKMEIVAARYLASLVFYIYGMLIMLAGYALLRIVGPPSPISMPWISLFLRGLAAITLLASLLFPVYFKLGIHRARGLVFFMFFLFYPLFFWLPGQLSKPKPDWIEALLGLPDALKAGLAVAFCAGLTSLSMLLSVKLYRTREF